MISFTSLHLDGNRQNRKGRTFLEKEGFLKDKQCGDG